MSGAHSGRWVDVSAADATVTFCQVLPSSDVMTAGPELSPTKRRRSGTQIIKDATTPLDALFVTVQVTPSGDAHEANPAVTTNIPRSPAQATSVSPSAVAAAGSVITDQVTPSDDVTIRGVVDAAPSETMPTSLPLVDDQATREMFPVTGEVLDVHAVPLVDVAMPVSTVELPPTVTKIASSGAHITWRHMWLASVRTVHVIPSGELAAKLDPPKATATNNASASDQAIDDTVTPEPSSVVCEVHVSPPSDDDFSRPVTPDEAVPTAVSNAGDQA